ncbi:MAG TPA: acyltransferase family protein [Nocardioidaceae bacterium]|nr:acyltransferase family protein [Nocardioidaceae bacterium]
MGLTYRPSLDGLRALAMYLIVLFHAGVPGVGGSFISVDLFFVLSGYLVTSILVGETESTGRLRLGAFYARRVRRLLPAAVVAVVGTSLLFLLIDPVVRRLQIIGDAQGALLYFANWRFIAQANDYFAPTIDKSPFLHYWTLSIEEQFYLVFPILLLLLVKLRRRLVLPGLCLITGASIGLQFYWSQVDPNHAYYGTDARMYQLAAGAVLAIVLRRRPYLLGGGEARVVAVTGMVGFLGLCLGAVPLDRPTRGVFGTLACVLLIAGLMQAEHQRLGRWLSSRTPVYLGKLSYATYLWHWPILLALEHILKISSVTLAAMSALLATGIAAASAELLERPVLGSSWLGRFRWRTAVSGVGCSALVAALVVPLILSSQQSPALVSAKNDGYGKQIAKAEGNTEKAPSDINWKHVDSDKGTTHTCAEDAPQDCIVVRGSGPTVVVVGDSQARMLSKMFTNLAKKHDFTLAMNDIPNCTWQENLQVTATTKAHRDACTQARVGWYEKVLPRLHPDLVIVVSYPRDNKREATKGDHAVRQRNGRHDPLEKAIHRATMRTARTIEKSSRLLMIENVIVPITFDPNTCLTSGKSIARCSVPVPTEHSPSNGFYQAAAAESPKAYTANLNPALCPSAPICRPIVDGTVVWRNKRHYTPGYADARRAQVWKLIKESGALNELVQDSQE